MCPQSSIDLIRWLWLRGTRGRLAEDLSFLIADCQAQGLGSSRETVSQALQVLFGTSSQSTVVCKQEVVDQSFLHSGVGSQSPQIKEAPVSSVADRGASAGLGEPPRHHLSEQQTEEGWGQDGTLFHTVRDWKWARLNNQSVRARAAGRATNLMMMEIIIITDYLCGAIS